MARRSHADQGDTVLMVAVPIAEFGPDMPDLADKTATAYNVVPRTKASYGPLQGLTDYSDALGATCTGAISIAKHDGTTYVFAGTATGLYMTTGATSWTDVTNTGGAYTGTGEYWRFAQFKDIVYATNFADDIQYYDLTSSTDFADLAAGSAPKARHIAVVKGFLMVGDTEDATDGQVRQRVWWSKINDPSTWPTPGSATAQAAQSDYNDLVGVQGALTGLVGHLGGCDGALFFERGVWRAVYQGPPGVFGFYPAEGVLGTRAPNSITPIGPVVYYLGEDGFYVFDGTSSRPIGVQRVDRWFYSLLATNYIERVVGAVDVLNKLVFWIFPSVNSVDGTPDNVIIYNWAIDRWSYGALSADWIMRALSFGVTLEGLDALYPGGLETVPYSLDSRAWIGGDLQLAAITSGHKLSYFTGDNLAAQIGTSVAQIHPGQQDPNTGTVRPGKRSFVRSVRPLVEGSTSTVAVSVKQTLGETTTYGDDIAVNTMGECPQRAEGRYISGLVKIAAATEWDHFQGLDIEAEPAGWR